MVQIIPPHNAPNSVYQLLIHLYTCIERKRSGLRNHAVEHKGQVSLPVAMSKRKENMLPRSSPAHRILPGASNDSDSTRPVSLLEPPLTFFPVEMFTTCSRCLLFPTCTENRSGFLLLFFGGGGGTHTHRHSHSTALTTYIQSWETESTPSFKARFSFVRS